ncbi:uncharacterized protein LOC121632555 [Melanotaenia boesemani]|uniref:uncharacterized protein LOC121632555 n=1 Tax=Melanotaenia boesemani TaxID=1250792 RepID=UPI001C045A0A|nr:uncharacterized protein LOC121632555 [Melanotaenia boesemani]
MMNKSFISLNGTASPAHVKGNYTKCGQMSMKAPDAGDVIDRGQNRTCKERRGPGNVTRCQVPRQRPLSTSSMMTVTLRSHQRQWADDICVCGIFPVIIEKKNKKKPQPPQRSVSYQRPQSTTHSSFKRYSCPPIGISASSGQSSSSSSSTTSSCSSPPPVQTSVITGHDPLGWKLQPISSSSSSRARANRLSLQIPIPVIPVSNSPNSEPSSKTKPELRPKPPRRHNSESSAFLRSLANPAVTPEQLCTVHLRPITFSDEVDNVFGEVTQEQEGTTAPPCKIPPPVMEKTAMARQIAQLIANSRQCYRPLMAKNNKNIYSSVIKPNNNNKPAAKMAGLHLQNGMTSNFDVQEESRRLS